MVEQDTIRLLRECDSGVKMGLTAIDDVIVHVSDMDFRKMLGGYREKYANLDGQLQELLDQYRDDGKEPSPIAKGMSKMKTGMKLLSDDSDRSVADLLTDGNNMGVKSLSRYLNQYTAADEKSKKITKKLIQLGEDLTKEIRSYL
jgi:hypothetical protein